MSVVTRAHPSVFRNTKKNERAESQLNARDKRKKKAKQAIDNPNAGKLKRRTDPGVPNLSGVISRLQQQHDNNKYVKRDQANAKKREDMMKRRKELSVPLTTEQSLLRAAQQSDEFHFEMKETAKDSDVAKRRPFWKELTKVIEAADIILEVLDARDPLGCRCPDVENVIKAKMTADGAQNKRIILVLNKIDLVPMDNVLAWVKYFRREYPCIAFKANTQQQKNNMSQATAKASQVDKATLSRSHCIGGDQLRQLLKNYSRSHDMKKSVTVGIIGYPNVGKSSIINSLKRSGAVNVGATPGLTKTLQEVKLDKQISLIDSPGVMFSAGSDSDEEGLLLRNCLRVEQLANPERAVYAIVKRCTSDTLTRIYEIPNFHNADEFIAQVAMRRNKLVQKGGLDLESTARMIVKDWNDGKIPYHTQPPVSEGVIQSDIVGSWSATFDIDALMNPSIEHVDEDEMDDDDGAANNVLEEDEKQQEIVPRPLNAPEMEDDSTSDERLLAARAAIQQSTSSSSSAPSHQSITSSSVIPAEFQKNKQLKHQQKEQRLQQRRMSQAATAGPVMDLMDS